MPEEQNPTPDALHRRHALATPWRVLLVGATMVTFFPVLFNGFVNWDDNQHLIDNPSLHIRTIHHFWMHPYFGLYIPVTYSIWTLVAGTSNGGPLNPMVFHLLNLVMHAATVVVVFEIIRLLLKGDIFAAALGAILFAVHPLQVEPVAWVSGFRDVLGGFFALLAIYQYLVARDRQTGWDVPQDAPIGPGRGTAWRFALATVCFVLAVLSKPTTAVTPLMCLALDRCRIRNASAIRWLCLWLLIAVAIIVVTRSAQPAGAAHSPTAFARVQVAGDAVSFYLIKLLAPLSLGVDYGRTPATVLRQPLWVRANELLIPLMLALAVFRLRHRFPLICRGLLAATIALLPVLGLVSFDFQQYSTVADRYAYLPLFGVAVALAAVVSVLQRKQNVLRGVGFFLGAFALRSFGQTFVWHDSRSLFEHALLVNERSALACSELASISLDEGNAVDAQLWAAQALDRNPDWALPYVTFGAAALRRVPPGWNMAQASYRAALARDPNLLSALTNLAALLAQQSQLPEAEALCRRAIFLEPADVSAHINLGNILAAQGKLVEAQAEFELALNVSPENEQAHTNLAADLARMGQRAAAEQHLRAALLIDPQYAPALRLLDQLEQGSPMDGSGRAPR